MQFLRKFSILGLLICWTGLSATVHNVSVTSNVFTPSNLTITAGDTVLWTNNQGFHNVNGTQATYPNNPASFGNAVAGPGWTYQFQFTIAGTYDYQCDPHLGLGMVGQITVNPAPMPSVPCSKPFFSEYIEGSSNNKGFEIYNPTASSLDLGPYQVYLSGNGGSFTNSFNLTGNLASGDVYVLTTDQADPTMLAVADTALPFPSVAHFNGDDALFLVDTVNNDTLDIIGVIGVDPGSSWPVGSGSTQNHTLVRMANVDMGTTDWTVGATQWMVNPSNTFSFLGSHVSTCVAAPCTQPFISEYIEGSSNNKGFEIYNPSGSSLNLDPYQVYLSGNGGSFTNSFDLSGNLASGDVYVITTDQADPTMLAVADTALPFPSVAHFNGDDALFLVDTVNSDTLDIIGVIGVDPGSSWPVGSGSTQNHTLVRMATVDKGQTDWAIGATEWMVNPSNTFSFLGSHSSNCVVPAVPTANFTQTSLTVQESVGSFDVDIVINPASATNDTILLQFIPGVGLDTADGSTTPPVDTATGQVSFFVPAGQDTVSFTFNIIDDAVTENNETAFVAMSYLSAGLIAGVDSSFTLIIEDNDQLIPTYDIADVSTVDANGEPDSLNVYCKLNGVVFTDDFDGNNGFSFYIYDNTGGINIFNFSDVSGYTVNRGDSIRVVGEIDFFNGLTELFVDSIAVLATGVPLKSPQEVSVLDESTESEFIRLNAWYFVDTNQWNSSGSSFNIDITNGADTFQMRVDSDIDLAGQPLPATGLFDLVGVGGQFDNSSPYFDNYQIFPRDASDLMPIPEYNIGDVTTTDASGNADSLGVRTILYGVVYTDDFDDNNGYSFYAYDNTGGINVFNFSDVSGYQVTRGDSIMMLGEIDQFRGLTELFVDSIYLLSSGNALKQPQVVSVLDESTEGEYIRMNGWVFVDTTQWTTGLGNGGFNVDITNGTDTFVMRIDAATDLYNLAIPTTDTFDVIGAGSQFTFSSPATDGYQIFPRDSADIIVQSGVSLKENNSFDFSLYPNPAGNRVKVFMATNAVKTIELYSITGVKEMSITSRKVTEELDLSSLPRGVYVLSVEMNGERLTRKLILE